MVIFLDKTYQKIIYIYVKHQNNFFLKDSTNLIFQIGNSWKKKTFSLSKFTNVEERHLNIIILKIILLFPILLKTLKNHFSKTARQNIFKIRHFAAFWPNFHVV